MGKNVQKREPHKVRKIARSSTIEKLLPVFEQVVSDSGTAGWAEIEGLQIAGKTGTAQKYVDGRYQARYLASFAGFFPRSEEHTSELQSRGHLVCRLLLETTQEEPDDLRE